ncbi:hypothetical protein VP01_7357g1, partial [Puccinia sorghi]
LFLNRFPNSTAHEPDTLLGMDVNKKDDNITLSQDKLIQKGIDLLGIHNCKPALDEEKKTSKNLNINYRTFTGILNYLFNNEPCIENWKQGLNCWKYVKGTRHLHLKLNPPILEWLHFFLEILSSDGIARSKEISPWFKKNSGSSILLKNCGMKNFIPPLSISTTRICFKK